MSKININKRLWCGLGVALTIAAAPFIGTFAYGPERRTFTANSPADYVTFNSMTDNPKVGDERNFVRIREVGQEKYVDSINIVPGKEYEVYTFFHNNASSTLNSKEHNYKGIALDTKLQAKMPSIIKKGTTVNITSTISAKNANPLSVWDHVTVSSPAMDVALRYIPDTAKIFSNGAVNGRTIHSDLFSSGAMLGYSHLNGIIPGCTDYSGYVTYRFKAEFSDFTINKTVSEHGKNNWVESQNASPNGKVDFKIHYKNTGTLEHQNVTLKDILPAGLEYISGTTKITNISNPNGKILSDNIHTSGINIGTYSFGADATITFTAKVASEDKLVCGVNTLTNRAQIFTASGGKQDDAKVVVNKNCTPVQEKEFCKVPGKGHLKKDDPKCFENCKITGKENLKSNDPNCNDPCKVPGKENLKSNDPNCFEPCKVPGKSHLKKDDPNCKNGDKCAVPGKGNLAPNDPNCFEPCKIPGKNNLKSNDPNCVEKCKTPGFENLNVNDPKCNDKCRIRGYEHLRAGDPNCKEIPAELPKTGPAETALTLVAILAISGAVAYWFRSREEFKKVSASIKKDNK